MSKARTSEQVANLDCTPGISYLCGRACIPHYKRCLQILGSSNDLINTYLNIIKNLGLGEQSSNTALEKAVKFKLALDKLKDKKNKTSLEQTQLENMFLEYERDYKAILDASFIDFVTNSNIGKYETLEQFLNSKDAGEGGLNSVSNEALYLLVELHAEKRAEELRNGEIGDDIDNYSESMFNSLEYVARLTGEDDINIVIDKFLKNSPKIDKSEIDAIKSQIRANIEIVYSRSEKRVLSDNIRFSVLNNDANNKFTNNVKGKVAYNIRNALDELSEKDINIITKLYDGIPLKEEELNHLLGLFQDNSNSLDSDYKDGLVLIRIGIINKLAEEKLNSFDGSFPKNALSLDDDSIQELIPFIESPFIKSLGSKNDDRLYLGGSGSNNKLFKNNEPFGNGRQLSKVIIGPALGNILEVLNKKMFKKEEEMLPDFLNPNSKKLADNYKPKSDEDGVVLQAKKKFIGFLRQVVVDGGRDNTKDITGLPGILNVLQKNLPSSKKFNANYVGPNSPDSFRDILERLSTQNPNGDLGDDLLNQELINRQAKALLNKLDSIIGDDVKIQEFLQKDVLQFMRNFGFEDTDAAEFLPVFYASINGREGAILDKYDGKPFPFADAIINDKTGKIRLVSVKYGKSGGVPADANALTNLINPEYTILVGAPGVNKKTKKSDPNEWDKFKSNNAIIEFTDKIPGIKLKDRKPPYTKADIINNLASLSGHFNFEELESMALDPNNNDQFIKNFYNKINVLAEALANNDEETLKVLFEVYNIDGMQKKYNAQAIKVKNAKDNIDAIKELKRRINLDRPNNPITTDSEILALNKNELKEKYGFDIKLDTNGNISVSQYYENYDLQMGLSHISMAMWEQDVFNEFLQKNQDLIPAENHPDLNLDLDTLKKDSDRFKNLLEYFKKNPKLADLFKIMFPDSDINNPEQTLEFFKLIFSNRTDAGASSRPSSGGTQYKFGGFF